MEKRGVSPLIATVLIVAFVIILFALVTTWTRRAALEPAMQTGEEEIASVLECADTDLSIVSASETGGDLTIEVDNIGSRQIYGIKVRAIDDDGGVTVSPTIIDFDTITAGTQPLDPLERSSPLTVTGVGTMTPGDPDVKIEVYPVLISGVCQGRFVSTQTVG